MDGTDPLAMAISIDTQRDGQQMQKVIMARLLQSVEQAGQIQAPVRGLDQVQISPQAQALYQSGA